MNKSIQLSFILLLSCITFCSYAQNLLDIQGWTIGQGSNGIFNQKGASIENIREWGIGPQGNRAILWKSTPDGDVHADGGWDTAPININHEMMYRYTIWMKKTNSNDGSSYFGCQDVLDLNNSIATNAYFWYGDLPELDKWYLIVGYIHASNDTSIDNYGGIYDGLTGAKVANINDYKFPAGASSAYHRSYLFYDTNINDRQYFYAPRIDMVNGNEPSIEALLGIQKGVINQSYFPGNVGIGTITPKEKLSVNGKIRAHEIKVETANWPDYVFEPDYKVAKLEELESYIKANKHLPEVPSAKEVGTNGVELGEVNKILLKKIEELTLHLIEKDKEIKELSKKVDKLLKFKNIDN